MIKSPALESYAAGYNPAKYRMVDANPHVIKECECGAALIRTVYKLKDKDLCLSCALDEAGIEVERVDRDW